MSMTLNSQGVEAKRNLAALEKIGVKIDDSLMTTFQEWAETAHALATFEVQGNERERKLAEERFDSLRDKLDRKGNPIVLAIAQHRLGKQKAKSDSHSEVLTEVTKQKVNANTGDVHKITGANSAKGSFMDVEVFAT
jgi:hypothetical protein